jgi:methionyl-tRNA formyltransferase
VRIVFLGTSEFAAQVLVGIADHYRPVLLITRPDRPSGRGQRLLSPPLAAAGRALGIELAQPQSVNDPDTLALIDSSKPDVVVVCAFGALIKEPLLSAQLMLNVHPSLLPRWRGAAPIERAIMAGDEQSGVSIMRVTAGLDSGPVCQSTSEPIDPLDSYGSLAPRLSGLGAELLLDALQALDSDQELDFAQQDETQATYAEKITASERTLDCERSVSELERTVRALQPHIGARVPLPDGTMLGVQQARIAQIDPPDARRRGVFASAGGLLLGCSDGVLELLTVQPAGKRAMQAAAFMRGHELAD